MILMDEEELVKIIEKASPWVVNISVSMVQDAYMNAAPVQGMGSGIVITKAETHHGQRYTKLLKELEAGTVFKNY